MNSTVNIIFDKITIKNMFFLAIVFSLSIVIGFYVGKYVYTPVIKVTTYNKVVHIITFRKIFFNNYMVALILVFLGYFSGGIITVLVIMVNGLTTGYGLNYLRLSNIGGLEGFTKKIIFHAPLELFALFLMGNIGLRGFTILRHFIRTRDFSIDKIIISKQIVYQYFTGTILLLLAAYIESLVIKFNL